jgi:uncharacterized protein (TIGR00369 family)
VPAEREPSPSLKKEIDPRFSSLVDFLENKIPFNRLLGIELIEMLEGRCILHLPWKDELIGDPTRPAVHGGVISTLLDTAGGAACFSMLSNAKDRVSTVDLRVDYLRPGPALDYFCRAEVVRMGNKVAVARMELRAGGPDDDQVLSTGTGVYNVVRRGD